MAPPTDDRAGDVGSLADTLRKRAPLLALLADGPRDQRDLREPLGVSRSTVYKSLDELADAGLVADRGERYALTEFGRLAWQRHDAYVARLRRLSDARPLLDAVPDDRQLPPSLFEHGRIVLSGRHAPERPLSRLEELGSAADHLRVAAPAGMPRYLGVLHENAAAGEQTVEMVVVRDALGRLEFGYDDFEAAVATEGLEVRVVDEELPFTVTLFDEDALGVFAYEDVLVGAAFTEDDDALRWGRRTFERIRARSEPV
jgi:predicted transcriptional regulator